MPFQKSPFAEQTDQAAHRAILAYLAPEVVVQSTAISL